MSRVAVTSRSFSRHPILREKLCRQFPDVKFNETGQSLKGAALLDFLQDSEKAIIALETLDAQALESLPKLKVISKYGVGLNNLDLSAMAQLNKYLGWQPGVNANAVAELALMLMLTILRRTHVAIAGVAEQQWQQIIGTELSGKTIGIMGCGHIGKLLVKRLQGFDCRILVNDIAPDKVFYQQYGLESVTLETLFSDADVISLHAPLDDTTHGIIDAAILQKMKPTSVLINTARGGIVNETALLQCLEQRTIAGAAFDVFEEEPPQFNQHHKLENFLITPHIGGSSSEAIMAMGEAAIWGLTNAKQIEEYDGIL